MVRADLLDAMDQFLRLNGPVAGKPFVGIQIVFVGDLFQLPPVVKKREEEILGARRYETPFFFSAKVLQDCQFAPVELSRIYRQTDTEFVAILDRVRAAEELGTVVPSINQYCYAEADGRPFLITLSCPNASADDINQSRLDALPGEIKIFTGEISGKFDIQQEKLPSPLSLRLKVGAQVMFTKNDELKRWVNGAIGRVAGFEGNVIRVELVSGQPGEICDARQVSWESFKI